VVYEVLSSRVAVHIEVIVGCIVTCCTILSSCLVLLSVQVIHS